MTEHYHPNKIWLVSIVYFIGATVGFVSDLFTAILGGIAIVALIRNGKKVGALIKLLVSKYQMERISRLKETLGQIEKLSASKKNERPTIYALLGRLSGQLKSLSFEIPEIKSVCDELAELEQKAELLTEAKKNRLVQEVHSALEQMALQEAQKFLE